MVNDQRPPPRAGWPGHPVSALHLGHIDTDMSATITAPKHDPAEWLGWRSTV
jgi:hypothetical protein